MEFILSLTPQDLVKYVITPALSAIFGAILSIYIASTYSKRTYRWTITDGFVKEFYSSEFIKHRISIEKTKKKLMNSDINIKNLSRGYWYSKDAIGCYIGDDQITSTGLSEHAHVTMILGYYIRLSSAYNHGLLDKSQIIFALKFEHHWHADVLTAMAILTRATFKSRPEPEPNFVEAIYTINSLLGYEYNKYKEFDYFKPQLS